jgi:hypothetical protein
LNDHLIPEVCLGSMSKIKILVNRSSFSVLIWLCCWLPSSIATAQEPEPMELKLPPVGTLKPESIVLEKPEDLGTENPAYRPANELVAKSRELLGILQIDESLLRRALQGIPLGEDDLEVFLEMLFRLPQLDMEKIEPLVQALPAWDKLSEETPRYLGGVYRLKGIVVNFEDLTPPEYSSTPEKIPDESLDGSLKRLASRKTIQHIYRTQLLVGGKKLEVYTTRVPQAWRKKKTKDQQLAGWEGGQEVEVWGYLLKQGDPDSGAAYYFAAPRVRWYPNTELGKLGFDYELFDDVQQKRTLLKGENEVFYELLAIAKRTPDTVFQLAKPLDNQIIELWQHPEKQVGELLTFHGLTRHVARIAVEDPALAQRLGFDHYYYLELFVPLKIPTIIQIPKQKEEETPEGAKGPQEFDKIHFDSMPLVFYFHQLPPGETVQSLKNKQVEVRGFFLKSWRYQSNVELSNKKHASLLGPLLMGNQPLVLIPTPLAGANIPGLLILSIVGGSVLIGIIYLWLNHSDRNKRPLRIPDKIEVNLEEVEPRSKEDLAS